MSHADKSALYQELKAAGVQFEKQYREYTTEELQIAIDKLHAIQGVAPGLEEASVNPQIPPVEEMKRQYEAMLAGEKEKLANPERSRAAAPPPPEYHPDTEAGLRLNTTAEDEVIGVDEKGFEWYQYEVRKPSFPQPRRRRVLRFLDTGTKVQTVQNGNYIETFEISGDEKRQSEARITLPSYQVGIYKDPRYPFKIHIYNENRGFDLFQVQAFYGGSDLVPMDIKRIYIENVLCYDIRTTIRAIEAEARRLDLQRGQR